MLAAIILAAGESKRMGMAKLTLKYKAETLLDLAIKKAMNVAELSYCVIGARQEYLTIAQKYKLKIIQNPDWQEGIASSLRAAIRALPDSVDAILVILPDQPFVEVSHLKKLIEKYEKSDSLLVYSKYQGALGVPAIISRELFPNLLQLSGDKGARALTKQAIDYSFVELLRSCDIDTPDDLKLLD